MNIGERILKMRKAKNISVYRISMETGISQNHIRDIELGRRNPSVETLSRLVAPLGITLSELFNEDENLSYLSENERRLIENYRLLPEEKAKLLFELSKLLNEK